MAYLLGAIALAALLAWLVVWWNRRPKSMAKGIDEFWEARQAIAPRPPDRPEPPDRGRGDDDDGDEGDTGDTGDTGDAGSAGRRR